MTYTQPLILLFTGVALVGLARLRHCKGFAIPTLAVLGLLLLSWPPVDWLLSRPLERPYPVRPFQPEPAEVIVVLASDVRPPQYDRPYPLPDHETYARCEYAAWLYHHWRPLPVLACGGGGRAHSFAATMRQLLQRAGVPETMIWTEETSRSTHESAVYGTEILRKHGVGRIALVVEAQSMLRAAACFRKQGVTVVPAPSEFRTLGPLSEELLPGWKAILRNEVTLHETVGLAWYRLRGWI
jgi:uncharacterized SAM-binding protein YcdF (DUF218 family)